MAESAGPKNTSGEPASFPADSSLRRAITRYPSSAVFYVTNVRNYSPTGLDRVAGCRLLRSSDSCEQSRFALNERYGDLSSSGGRLLAAAGDSYVSLHTTLANVGHQPRAALLAHSALLVVVKSQRASV